MKLVNVFSVAVVSATTTTKPLETCGIVGGGVNYEYAIIKENLNSYVTVSTLDDLKTAVTHNDKFIFLPPGTVIDLPHDNGVVINVPAGTTIFGDRGIDGSRGALLRTPSLNVTEDLAFPLILLQSNTRISGLRVEGISGELSSIGRLIGLQTAPGATNVEIDNSEIFHWQWAGVSVNQSYDIRIHHNYIHNNARAPWGFGIAVQDGNNHADIYCNVFVANRHSIAGSGEVGDSYSAHDNLVLNSGGLASDHQYDMHKGTTGIGGKSVHVVDNVFDYGQEGTNSRTSIYIGGVPSEGPITCEGNIFKQGYELGDEVAVDGVAGAIPSIDEIQQKNMFNTVVTYGMSGGGCFVSYVDDITRFHVDCDSIGTIIQPHFF